RWSGAGRSPQNRRARLLAYLGALFAAFVLTPATLAGASGWSTHGGNPQHTALSSVAAQPLEVIHWATPVDLAPPSGTILIHYGSPLVTPANTVIIPVKTGSTGGFKVEARNGTDGAVVWSQPTDYILPSHSW